MRRLHENLFAFEYEVMATNCFVVLSDNFVFVVDSYLGPDFISDMASFVESVRGNRQVMLLNTHSHYDHVWGNCLFEGRPIIGHELCRKKMLEEGERVLSDFRSSEPEIVGGDVRIVPPSMVFSDRLVLHDGDFSLSLEHFPGHSCDSVIIAAEPWHECFAGDSLEDPFPLVHESREGASVLASNLRRLRDRRFGAVYPAHGKRTDPELIDDNIEYLDRLVRFGMGEKGDFGSYCELKGVKSPFYVDSHRRNLEMQIL